MLAEFSNFVDRIYNKSKVCDASGFHRKNFFIVINAVKTPMRRKTNCIWFFKDYFSFSTLAGVSFPLTIVFELMAMALIISAMLLISNVPISSLCLW